MSKNKVMYVGNFSFTKQNRTGYGYNFAEFSVDDAGNKRGTTKTLFTNTPVKIDGLTPGDIVNCVFSEPEYLGANSSLVSISIVEKSMIFK